MRTILALGGGGFTAQRRDPALDGARPCERCSRSSAWPTSGGHCATEVTTIEPDLIAPGPRGTPADARELRAMRYGSRRD